MGTGTGEGMSELASHREYGRGRWSGGWLDALAELPGVAAMDLIRARAYAREGRVGEMHIEPGIVSAWVQDDDRPRPYPVALTVPVLADTAWDRFIDAVSAQAAHLAALLEGEPPQGIGAERVLLPGRGELRTVCTCAQRDRQPCRHTAAACYETAAVFDEDPFALLLLRGRSKPQVLAALREHRGLAQPLRATPGRLASDGYRAVPAPLPALAPLPPEPVSDPADPPAGPAIADPPAASGLTGAQLTHLAQRAARAAWDLLAHPQEPSGICGKAGAGRPITPAPNQNPDLTSHHHEPAP
jgi:uncharacterized Zn finger protein